GTYNARFLPHLPSNARRAEVLADRIRDGGYDLILLTEVFSGRARRILVGKLARDYPWNVQYIGSKRMLREDSGLMLLSRLPFDALPTSSRFHHPRVRASASGTTPDWTHVWFVEYTDCSHSDCLAGKGAGYVRVRPGGTAIKVFFTHMQARYDHHSPRKQARTRDIRRAQLQQLADLVREALGADGDPGEPAIILGDFNVDGARSANGHSPPSGPDGDEWRSMLEHLNGLFRDGVIDVWDRYAPGADPGHTFSTRVPHARRDYVLMSATDPALPLSVHHAALAYNLASSNGQLDHRMSDHLGINVDLNLPQAGCHPMDAHSVAAAGERMTVDGWIRHPGGLQWYRIAARGTFAIELGFSGANPTAALEVYDGGDISRPLGPVAANGAGVLVHRRRYALAGETFIRVGIPRSGLSGEYSLSVAPVP
ncbi:MAG: endonuclease/exonuclease/phosphatase family protein, partial [Gemmatimonadales bacterium]|nr:endonuclease/exonuclease/phosphatase family protein [Gemmatimonadales bacterium]